MTGPAQSLAVDAVAVRNDNRIALDFVRDRAAEASSSSHDSCQISATQGHAMGTVTEKPEIASCRWWSM